MLIEITYNVTDVFVSTTQTPIYVSVSFEQPSGGGGTWGSITGTLSNQTDLQSALDGKFDDPTGTTSQYLRGDGSLATFPAIPSGTVQSVGLTMPSAFSVANSPVTSSGTLAVTGAGTTAQYIRGDGSLATFPSLTGYVPYTGATSDVNLGTHRITAQNATISSNGSGDTVTITHSSGSGNGLNITKGGNGEGLYINKTSGSGNAATIIGTLNATTLVKSGGTSSQFLKADGSVDSSTYVGGSGAAGQVAYWDGTNSVTGIADLTIDTTLGRVNLNKSYNGTVAYYVTNANTGSNSIASFSAFNGVNGVSYGMNGTNITTYGAMTANSGYFYSTRNIVYMADSASNGILQFATGGNVEKMRIFTTGNLLLQNGGTFTDSGQRLQVQGTTLLNGNVTFSSSTGMFWDATNSRLGIGTNAPAYTVDVSGTMRGTGIYYNTGYNISVQRLGLNNGTVGGNFGYIVGSSNGVFRLVNSAESDFTRLQFGGTTSSFPALQRVSNALAVIDGTGAGTSNLLVGSTTDSGERLQVTGDTLLKGSGATGGTFGLKVQNSNGVNILRTRNDGPVFIEAVNTVATLYMSSNGDSLISKSTSGTNGMVLYGPANAHHTVSISSFSSDNYSNGALSSLRFNGNFVSASGSTAFSYMLLNGTINQTGTSTSIVRGLYINPTLTAAADFRAIETARGNVVFGNLPTSPVGLPTGAIWNNLGMINIV
jgi:hypothetical protein